MHFSVFQSLGNALPFLTGLLGADLSVWGQSGWGDWSGLGFKGQINTAVSLQKKPFSPLCFFLISFFSSIISARPLSQVQLPLDVCFIFLLGYLCGTLQFILTTLSPHYWKEKLLCLPEQLSVAHLGCAHQLGHWTVLQFTARERTPLLRQKRKRKANVKPESIVEVISESFVNTKKLHLPTRNLFLHFTLHWVFIQLWLNSPEDHVDLQAPKYFSLWALFFQRERVGLHFCFGQIWLQITVQSWTFSWFMWSNQTGNKILTLPRMPCTYSTLIEPTNCCWKISWQLKVVLIRTFGRSVAVPQDENRCSSFRHEALTYGMTRI